MINLTFDADGIAKYCLYLEKGTFLGKCILKQQREECLFFTCPAVCGPSLAQCWACSKFERFKHVWDFLCYGEIGGDINLVICGNVGRSASYLC